MEELRQVAISERIEIRRVCYKRRRGVIGQNWYLCWALLGTANCDFRFGNMLQNANYPLNVIHPIATTSAKRRRLSKVEQHRHFVLAAIRGLDIVLVWSPSTQRAKSII